MVWMSLDFHQLDLTDGWIITCRYIPYNTSHPPDWEVWGSCAKHISLFVFISSLARSPSCPPSLYSIWRESVLCCTLIPEVTEADISAQTGLKTHTVLFFYLQVTASGITAKSLFGVTFFINLEFLLLNCAVLLLWPSRLPVCAKGRDSLPSRRCWTARRRWEKRRASMRPVQVNLCGRVLFSTHLLYTPRNSRRSSGSLFRPDTRRHRRPQSPASTWSCLKRWRCVEVSHPGQNSSEKKKRQISRCTGGKTDFWV